MTMENDELGALIYMMTSTDKELRDRIMYHIGIPDNGMDGIRNGIQLLINDGIASVDYDGDPYLPDLLESDPAADWTLRRFAMMIPTLPSLMEIRIMVNTTIKSMVVMYDSSCWVTIWKSKNNTVSIIGGFGHAEMPLRVSERLMHALKSSNGRMVSLSFQRYSLNDDSIMMGTTLSGSSTMLDEPLPDNSLLSSGMRQKMNSHIGDNDIRKRLVRILEVI